MIAPLPLGFPLVTIQWNGEKRAKQKGMPFHKNYCFYIYDGKVG